MKMGAVDWGAARRRSEVVFSLGRRPSNETGPGHPSDPATVTTARAGSTQGNVTTRPVSAAAGPSGVATMDVLYPCCAGLDVHKDSVYACVRRVGPGGAVRETVQVFGTMTPELLQLADWLAGEGATHVAMESTGVYWKPVYYLLDERFELLLANAQQLKRVPGRKTDTQVALRLRRHEARRDQPEIGRAHV